MYISLYLPLNTLNNISETSIFHHWQLSSPDRNIKLDKIILTLRVAGLEFWVEEPSNYVILMKKMKTNLY